MLKAALWCAKIPRPMPILSFVQVLKETNGRPAVSELLRGVHAAAARSKDLPTLSSILTGIKARPSKKFPAASGLSITRRPAA